MSCPVTEVRKNAREVIRITREEFNGHDLINLRVFYDAGEGVMKPGRHGLSFRADLLVEVLQGLEKIN